MGSHYENYTLADFLGLVSNHTATYQECAEMLEEELKLRFPWIKPDEFYPLLKKKSFDQEDYCYRLIKAGKQLEEMARN